MKGIFGDLHYCIKNLPAEHPLNFWPWNVLHLVIFSILHITRELFPLTNIVVAQVYWHSKFTCWQVLQDKKYKIVPNFDKTKPKFLKRKVAVYWNRISVLSIGRQLFVSFIKTYQQRLGFWTQRKIKEQNYFMNAIISYFVFEMGEKSNKNIWAPI